MVFLCLPDEVESARVVIFQRGWMIQAAGVQPYLPRAEGKRVGYHMLKRLSYRNV